MYHSLKDFVQESEKKGLFIDDTEQIQCSYKNCVQALVGKGPCINNVALMAIFPHTLKV